MFIGLKWNTERSTLKGKYPNIIQHIKKWRNEPIEFKNELRTFLPLLSRKGILQTCKNAIITIIERIVY